MNRFCAAILVISIVTNNASAVAADVVAVGKSVSGSGTQPQNGVRYSLELAPQNNGDVPLENQTTDRFLKLRAVLDKSDSNAPTKGGLGQTRAGLSTPSENRAAQSAPVTDSIRAQKLPNNAVSNSEVIDVFRNGNQFDSTGE